MGARDTNSLGGIHGRSSPFFTKLSDLLAVKKRRILSGGRDFIACSALPQVVISKEVI